MPRFLPVRFLGGCHTRSAAAFRPAALGAAALCAMLVAAGCSEQQSATTDSSSAGSAQSSEAAPSAGSSTSADPVQAKAEDLRTQVKKELGGAKITRDRLRQALASSGVENKDIELGQDTTPTGLEVDSLPGAVHYRDQCILLEVRDGPEVIATAGKRLGDGSCLAGNEHR